MMMSKVSGYVTSYPYNVTLGLFVAGTAAFALRRYMAGDVCYSKASLEDKTVVITGANTGIGLETAVDMAQRGAKVILACRSPEKGKAAVQVVKERSKNEAVVFSQLDLASLQSVRDFATSILNQEPRIDILINNAGVMVPPYTKTEDGFELQFGVNHLAHFLLTNLLLDRLKEAPAARIVNVSSEAHKQGTINFDDLQLEKSYSRFGGYSQSKLANILFTRSLAQRLKDTNVTAYALCPGPTNTGFAQHLNGFLRYIVVPVVGFFLLKTPQQGAQTCIHCAVHEGLEEYSGCYFFNCKLREVGNKEGTDDAIAARLWQVSSELVGLDK